MTYLEAKKQVDAFLHERRIPHGIEDLYNDSDLCRREYAEHLLELLQQPFSIEMLQVIARAFVFTNPTTAQRREATRIILRILRQNAHRYDVYLSDLGMRLADLADESAAHEIGQMALDKGYGRLRPAFIFALHDLGTSTAISYLMRAAQDPEMASCALEMLARLRVAEALPLCEQVIKKPDVADKGDIKQTYQKLKRFVAKKEGLPAHVTQEPIPGNLDEWSTNVDGSGLASILGDIQRCKCGGLGQREISTITKAVDALTPDRAVRFKFDVNYSSKTFSLWVEIFCDDDDDYALHIAGPKYFIQKFAKSRPRIPLPGSRG